MQQKDSRKKSYKPFLYLIVIIIFIIIGVWGYNQLNPQIEDKKETPSVENEPVQSEEKTSIWTILFFVGFASFFGYFLYSRFYKEQGEPKKRDEVIREMRKYAKEEDNIKLYQQIKYAEGYYKADHEFPIALVLYNRNKFWVHNKEPPASSIYGYLVDRRDLKNVLEDFKDLSIAECINEVRDTMIGMRTPHYKAYKTKGYEEEALKRWGEREEVVQEAIEMQKAIEERT